MATQIVLKAIDEEISKLQRARLLIAGDPTPEPAAKRRGRPKGSANKNEALRAPVAKKTSKRVMSAEGKARIAAAQKARWAAQKKAAAAPTKGAKKPTDMPVKQGTKKTSTSKAVAKKVSADKPVASKKSVPRSPRAELSAPAEKAEA